MLRYRQWLSKYQTKKSNAKRTGKAFLFTFNEWLAVWVASGKEPGRGRSGYCMARFGDKGPYAPGNVKIITNEENWNEWRPTKHQLKKMSTSHVGNTNKLGKKESRATRRLKSEIVRQRWKDGGYDEVSFLGRWPSARRHPEGARKSSKSRGGAMARDT